MTMALKALREDQAVFAEGDEPVQGGAVSHRFELRAVAYLGTNAPQAMDIPRGFSYTREVSRSGIGIASSAMRAPRTRKRNTYR